MAQILDLVPWPKDGHHIGAIPAVLLPVEPRTSRLAGVKDRLYHPALPTLRQMDMDTAMNKLPDEHSRTATACTKEDFNNSTFTLVGVPNMRLPSLGMTELGRSLTAKYQARKMAPFLPGTSQDEWPSYTCAMDDWSRFVSSAGEFRLPSINKKVLGFSYYAVRYLKPEVTQTWRYCLNQNPSLDRYGQKPIPYTSNNIFRSFGTAYSRSHYLQPWR
ncbi:PREDICTED: testis, prostate and placenta-expressed protein [Gavialis gangeticus]|uniref:testis, prostate and placenta-expressed protein n=1 Tax=Gavialis gangeticus TaxID=94835 RepID=UPI00092F586A|nr:PREDICTED: testis, prostate and placenta-expressed protein [Gavialis gangeticus]XP_019361453.1 PREDICTED: testis, prostate and placenta-expressed protein [Gavialis gangeticus]